MTKFTTCRRTNVDMVLIESAQDMLEANTENIEDAYKVLGLLGNEVRYKIILLLIHIERICVCDLSDILKMSQSPISQHLRKLKDAGLLKNKREGMTIYYFIPSNKREKLITLIEG
jgi:DNA-binding transcriptional ArsR family regulator